MSNLAPVIVNCTLCRHPMVAQINKRIRDQGIAQTMRWMEENGIEPLPHRNTFSTHKQQHLKDDYAREVDRAAKALREQQRTVKARSGDLAALVRDNVFARVEEGTLEPTLSEGLRAQEMLDRRTEKAGDRDLMIQLAGLLSGATQPVALLSDGSIEGTFREVEREEDEAAFAALLDG